MEIQANSIKMYDTTIEHAKEYGLSSKSPLFVQITFDDNFHVQIVDKYAQENAHDLIFGHIVEKTQTNIDSIKTILRKNGYSTIEGNNDFYKYL